MKRIVVAMSGGVDSSVAAWLLQHDGWDVVGMTLHLWRDASSDEGAPSAIADAEAICRQLDVPHHVVDCRDEFRRSIVEQFCNAYYDARTPNPCVLCNPTIKFAHLVRLAEETGAEAIATGHYARVAPRGNIHARSVLRRASDQGRDQSYMLYGLTQEQLAVIRFPLGELTKVEVRRLASEASLHSHDRPDSQEVCFIPDDDYVRFLEANARRRPTPGAIRDTSGAILGEHGGFHRFTIGQRRGLGIAVGEPRYVIAMNQATGDVVVGSREDTFSDRCTVEGVNWVAVDGLPFPRKAHVKIRHGHTAAPAVIERIADDQVRVAFTTPQSAITPGQAAVFYEGDAVLGGGTIRSVPENLRGGCNP